MHKDANEVVFDQVEIFGKPALLTEGRILRETVPQGIYVYDIRHGDDWGKPCSIENRVVVNHYGTLLLNRPIALNNDGYRRIRRKDLSYADAHSCTLGDYMKKYPPHDKNKVKEGR